MQSNRREFLIGRAALRALESSEAESVDAANGARVCEKIHEPPLYLLEVTRQAMACEFQVLLDAAQYTAATDHAIAALDLVEQLEEQLTVFRESSEVSQLNRSAFEHPVLMEPRLFGLLQQAKALYEATGGAFDITSGPLIRIWGFMRRQGRMPSDAEVAAALERVGCRYLELDQDHSTVRFKRPGMEINLGAIGKGYALDRCAERLLSCGIGDFLLHGGNSSILGMGKTSAGASWLVGLRDPLRPERRIAQIRVRDRAVGTSGTANQFFYHQGRRYGHIVDPRTGRPAQDLVGSTVLAPTAAEADAIATALFVMGLEEALAYCESRADISAVLIQQGERSGELRLSTVNLAEDDFQLID